MSPDHLDWELVTFCVCHIPVDGEDTRECMEIPKIKLWRKDEDMIDHQSFIYSLVSLVSVSKVYCYLIFVVP